VVRRLLGGSGGDGEVFEVELVLMAFPTFKRALEAKVSAFVGMEREEDGITAPPTPGTLGHAEELTPVPASL
jgi:hypothetical protein